MGPSAAPSLSRCDTGASGHFPAHDERRPGLARCRPALGTYVKIALRGASDDELIEHSRAAFAEIERVERALSFHDPHSELSRVNREAATRPLRLSQDLRTVLDFGSRLSRSTGGLFDVTVAPELVRRGALPDHGVDVGVQASWHDVRLEGDTVRFDRPLLIDLGGIAKGYAVDRAMAVIPPEVAATVNAGGDLRMRPWRDETLAVEVPDGRRCRALLTVPMQGEAVATSATTLGAEGSSIVCPHRREPVTARRSVSVFASTAMEADALAKVAFLLPGGHPIWRQVSATALVVDRHARTHWLGRV